MKKLIALSLVFIMLVSFTLISCGGSISDEDMDKLLEYLDKIEDLEDDKINTESSTATAPNDQCTHNEALKHAIAPTCTQTGLTEGKFCTVCGIVLVAQKIIEATGIHTPVTDPGVQPTCGKSGLTEGSHCSGCGAVIVPQERIAATENHTYGAGNLCSVCNSPKPSEGLAYTTNGDGTCFVAGFGACTDTKLVIPSRSPNGDIVTSIGENAFAIGYGKGKLTSVILPDSITTISEGAFKWNPNLKSISIPNSVTVIGDTAFFGSESLTSIHIPEGVTMIGGTAFGHCESLKSVVIPSSVKEIGGWAFSGCKSLTNVTFSKGDVILGKNLFAACDALTDITLPNGMTIVPEGIFYNCYALERVVIPSSVTSISELAFWQCRKLTTIVFNGSEEQWNAVEKGSQWDQGSGNYYVEFLNGDSSDLKDPIPEGACISCKGEGYVVCQRCFGSLIAVGKNSDGDEVFINCPVCTVVNTWYKCTDCNGTGLENGSSSSGGTSGGSSSGGGSGLNGYDCTYCNKTGKIECSIACDGTGKVFSHYDDYTNQAVYKTCSICHGAGKVNCYYCGGDGVFAN